MQFTGPCLLDCVQDSGSSEHGADSSASSSGSKAAPLARRRGYKRKREGDDEKEKENHSPQRASRLTQRDVMSTLSEMSAATKEHSKQLSEKIDQLISHQAAQLAENKRRNDSNAQFQQGILTLLANLANKQGGVGAGAAARPAAAAADE